MTRWERAAFAFFAGFVVTLCVCAVLLLAGCAGTDSLNAPAGQPVGDGSGPAMASEAALRSEPSPAGAALWTTAAVFAVGGVGLILWPSPALKRKGPR